jgi:hypothetical protein
MARKKGKRNNHAVPFCVRDGEARFSFERKNYRPAGNGVFILLWRKDGKAGATKMNDRYQKKTR